MNSHAAERVRSYLRGRLQRAINPTTHGRYLVTMRAGSPGDPPFTGTLEEIAARFNVTIPDSILKGPLDDHSTD